MGRTRRLFVPLTAETGLTDVHCAALRPDWHLLLSDTDVAPTALFEVRDLVQLCELICHNSLQTGQPGLIVGTEPHQDINAGLAIFPGTAASPQPGCLRLKVMAARLHLLERPSPFKPAEAPPTTALNAKQQEALATALLHAEHVQLAALSRTPLAGILAQNSHDDLAAWALLGTWTCTLVWPTPEACQVAKSLPRHQRPAQGAAALPSLGPQQLRAGCTLCPQHCPQAVPAT